MGLLRRSVVGESEPDTAVPELTTESSPERASVKERRRSSQRYENASQMASLLGSFASDPLAGSSIKESRAYLRAMQCAGNVWSVGLSHDCSLVVSGDGAGKVSVWSASKGTLIREMACEGEVTSVSLSEDANFIASGDLGDRPEDAEEKRKGKVRIWHTHTGELQQQFVCDGGVNCVHFVGPTKARRFSFSDALSKAVVGSSSSGEADFPPEQSFVASGDEAHRLRLWSLALGEMVRDFDCVYNVFSCWLAADKSLALAGDGGSDGGHVQIWDAKKGVQLRTMACSDTVLSACLTPDNKLVVSGDGYGHVNVWQTQTGDKASRPLTCGDEVGCARVSTDGALIVSGDFTQNVRLWDPFTGEELQSDEHPTKCDGAVNSIAMSPNKKMVVSGDDCGIIIVWNVSAIVGIAQDTDTVAFDTSKGFSEYRQVTRGTESIEQEAQELQPEPAAPARRKSLLGSLFGGGGAAPSWITRVRRPVRSALAG